MVRIGKVELSGRPVIWTSLKLGPDQTGHPSGSTFPILTMTPWKILFIFLNFDIIVFIFDRCGTCDPSFPTFLPLKIKPVQDYILKTLILVKSSEERMIKHFFLLTWFLQQYLSGFTMISKMEGQGLIVAQLERSCQKDNSALT